MYKKTLSLLGVALALSAFASQAESERQASRERIVEQVLKPCEGKKAGDKVVIPMPRRRARGDLYPDGGSATGVAPAARCRLSIPRRRLSGSRAGKQRHSGLLKKSPTVPGHEPVVR